MIMGAGKTTVVGPLLALILGDGRRLVAQVVPHALLEFSRQACQPDVRACGRVPLHACLWCVWLHLVWTLVRVR